MTELLVGGAAAWRGAVSLPGGRNIKRPHAVTVDNRVHVVGEYNGAHQQNTINVVVGFSINGFGPEV